jgi:hypothetical protein
MKIYMICFSLLLSTVEGTKERKKVLTWASTQLDLVGGDAF